MTGKERRKAKSAATERESPRRTPKESETPKRLIPAKRAALCPTPITKACPAEILSTIAKSGSVGEERWPLLEVNLSVPKRINPFMVKKMAALKGFWKLRWKKLLNAKPIRATGIVPSRSNQKSVNEGELLCQVRSDLRIVTQRGAKRIKSAIALAR